MPGAGYESIAGGPKDGIILTKCLVEEARGPMSVTIDLPPELEQSLRQYASWSRQEVSAIVVQAVREKIARCVRLTKSVRHLLRPWRWPGSRTRSSTASSRKSAKKFGKKNKARAHEE